MKKLAPLHDRILIKRTDAETVSKGGIIIPTTAQEPAMQGTVVGVGRGRFLESGKLVEPQVKKGDVVLFQKYGGAEVELEDGKYLVVREQDILGVFTNE